MKLALIGLILMQVLATCAPDYSRPDAALPPVYRDQPPAAATLASLGDLGWWQLFKDPQLLALFRFRQGGQAFLEAGQREVAIVQAGDGEIQHLDPRLRLRRQTAGDHVDAHVLVAQQRVPGTEQEHDREP